MSPDLCLGGLTALQAALKEAARIGYMDEKAGAKSKTGRLLARRITFNHRVGHQRKLRSAYMAGRWQYEMDQIYEQG